MIIEELLKETRLNAGWTQKEMAAGIVSESFYSKVERGIHKIDADTLVKILKGRKLNPVVFFKQAIDIASNEKNTASNRIVIKAMHATDCRDLQEWQQVFEEYKESSETGVEYTQWLSYMLDLARAWILRSPENITPKTREQIKRVINEKNWNIFTFNLLSMCLIALDPEQVKYFTHKAYETFKKTNGILDINSTTIMSMLATNFLIYAYLHNFAKKDYQEIFEFFQSLPMLPQYFAPRMIFKYYQALVNQNQKNIEKYGSILRDEKMMSVLQDNKN
ncbi:hypothetical protein LABF186_09910 [Lactobacillus amylovorus subsp. animalium]|uniref:HTH cro/C1-type domain-containing protein n=1 Tax=Lactobacillus amylovorus subsp. animalium TaxID=3378536 RepID=A0ABD0C3N2_LACAM|nr:hypothetical protein LABF186_09910 [Lactobacillus amylovorus]GMM15707.1 hypothetical protein LABF125_08400 [Lactobacillus amylovorus]